VPTTRTEPTNHTRPPRCQMGQASRNDKPKPFVWHKTADEIITNLGDYCQRITASDRCPKHGWSTGDGDAVVERSTLSEHLGPRFRTKKVFDQLRCAREPTVRVGVVRRP